MFNMLEAKKSDLGISFHDPSYCTDIARSVSDVISLSSSFEDVVRSIEIAKQIKWADRQPRF